MRSIRRHLCIFLTALQLFVLFGCQDVSRPQSEPPTESPTELITLPPPTDPPEVGELPHLYIVTEDGLPITSKKSYKSATLAVRGAENPVLNVELTLQIRGRGHSSFNGDAPGDDYQSKNSYRLKLDRAANLLGIGGSKDRDWVLISGKFDPSGLRNYIVWALAERMGSIPYVPSCTWVHLTVNGDYRGTYTLVEQIEVERDRVHIDDGRSEDPSHVGYLLEYDLRGALAANAKRDLTYFRLPGNDSGPVWVIKSRVYDEQATAAVRAHLALCNDAILSGERERMEQYVDMASFVDMFILQELSKNTDAGCSSFFVQRDVDGKLYLTAPWDFDFAFGSHRDSKSPLGLIADGKDAESHPWFEFLVTQPWFLSLVQARMAQVKPMLDGVLQELALLCPRLEKAADQNDRRWGIYGKKFSTYIADQASVALESYTEHVEFLISWTQKRWIGLDRAVRAGLS